MFREAHEVVASRYRQTREDKSVRNVAFSIMLGALALLQIAVVFAELSHSHVQTARAENGEPGTRYVLATAETKRKTSAF